MSEKPLTDIQKLLEGFQIFLRYKPESGAAAAGHEELSAGETPPVKMKSGDVIRLTTLGWFWNDEYDSWTHFL